MIAKAASARRSFLPCPCLSYNDRAADRATDAELAHAEQVKAPTMSRVVAGLVRTKLVHMTPSRADRRAVVITATKQGARLMQQARIRRVESLARAVSGLTELDVALLQKAADLIERLSRTVSA